MGALEREIKNLSFFLIRGPAIVQTRFSNLLKQYRFAESEKSGYGPDMVWMQSGYSLDMVWV